MTNEIINDIISIAQAELEAEFKQHQEKTYKRQKFKLDTLEHFFKLFGNQIDFKSEKVLNWLQHEGLIKREWQFLRGDKHGK